jgi:hypothetical protein
MLTISLPAALSAKHRASRTHFMANQPQPTSTQTETQDANAAKRDVPDCTVEFSGKISLASFELEYKCSSTQANCTLATNDAFNCLTAVYHQARRIIMK